MKKITKYLIIPLFSIFAFFLLFNTNVSAAISSGGSTGNDNTVVLPDDGIFEPCVSETGCNLTDEGIEQVNLYEECHTYITTNIISNESLVEALNGKIYTTFTQEDCMEMINIATKRQIIKNLFNVKNIDYSISKLNPTIIDNNNLYFESGIVWDTVSINIYNIEPNTKYVLSYIVDRNYIFRHVIKDQYGNNLYAGSWYDPPNNDGFHKISFVTKSDTEYITIVLGCTYRLEGSSTAYGGSITYTNIQLEKGSSVTPYVSYDYHREYYQEGIDYADNRVNTNSTSYTQGVTDADNRVNTNSTNYKTGEKNGYEMAYKDGNILGGLIPTVFGSIVSNTLPFLTYEVFGISLMDIIGIICMLGIVIVIIKFFV